MNITALLKDTKDRTIRKSLQYLVDLSKETSIDITDWNMIEVFGNDLAIPPQELNKKFFNFYRKNEVKRKIELADGHRAALEDSNKHIIHKKRKEIEKLVASLRSDISSYQREINLKAIKLREYHEVLDFNKETQFDMVGTVKEILDQGFWELTDVIKEPVTSGGRLLEFLSNEIVLSDEKGDGRDFKVNFGRIKFYLKIDGQLVAAEHTRQPDALIRHESNKNFHPFISSDGSICFGSGASTFANLQATNSFADMFLLLKTLLTTYPGDNPYVSLVQFYMSGRDKNGRQPWLEALSEEELRLYGRTRQDLCLYNFTCSGCGYRWNRPLLENSCRSCKAELTSVAPESWGAK